eukprot:Tamp_03259.p1 GENE.Tamp_03259~~Tamp_03259.p1  ORF type:complete len:626 (-),score=99.07 Tamp_03259:298-2175(-)
MSAPQHGSGLVYACSGCRSSGHVSVTASAWGMQGLSPGCARARSPSLHLPLSIPLPYILFFFCSLFLCLPPMACGRNAGCVPAAGLVLVVLQALAHGAPIMCGDAAPPTRCAPLLQQDTGTRCPAQVLGSRENTSFAALSHASTAAVSGLRGGDGAEPSASKPAVSFSGSILSSLGFATGSSTVSRSPIKGAQSPPRARISTRTRLRRRVPFWLSWVYPPEEAAVLPAPEEMVLIQGFDWELMSDRKKLYGMLEKEMPRFAAAGINVVWFPPPSSSADAQGYLPGKWYDIPFRKHLDAALQAARKHGIVSMADVVLNHRTASKVSSNSSDWTEFEDPAWGEWAIVKDDWKCQPEEHLKFCPDNCTCGNKDTGENACYAPDIDHTNTRVQKDVVSWLHWLRKDVGYDAFRFDNTKGYAGNYTAMYVKASSPVYSVGEYFDTNKDLLTSWINASEGKSSMFDFGMRYKLKDSIQQDNYEHMMEKFYGPMFWYDAHHSVTFLDNHDTAGELNDRFGTLDQILMGYSVILTHPSLPCIFWQDWHSKIQSQIQTLVSIRERNGIGPSSSFQVKHGVKGLYAAIIADRVAIKLGSRDWTPNGGLPTRQWKGVASGSGWCIWERIQDEEARG